MLPAKGMSDSALFHLQQVPETHSLAQRAEWYQVQACVIQRKLDCLRTRLQEINTQNSHYRQKMAQEWLQQLE